MTKKTDEPVSRTQTYVDADLYDMAAACCRKERLSVPDLISNLLRDPLEKRYQEWLDEEQARRTRVVEDPPETNQN